LSTCAVTRPGSTVANDGDSQQDGDEDGVRTIVVADRDLIVPVIIRRFQISYLVGELLGGEVMQGALWIVRDADLQIISSAILIMDIRSATVSVVDISQVAMVQFKKWGDYALFGNAVPSGVGRAAASVLEHEPWKSGWPILGVLATMLAGRLGYRALRDLVGPGLVAYHARDVPNEVVGEADSAAGQGTVPE
jgi:hypothetical protein